MMSVVLAEARPWFGKSTGRKIDVKMNPESPEVQAVRILTRQRSDNAGADSTFTAEVRELRGYIDPWEQNEDWFNAISYAVTQRMVDPDRIGIRGSSYSGGHVGEASPVAPRCHHRRNRGPIAAPRTPAANMPALYQVIMNAADVSGHVKA